jgi:hypothetical protein
VLNVIYAESRKLVHCAECPYAGRRYAECRYAERRYAECRGAQTLVLKHFFPI